MVNRTGRPLPRGVRAAAAAGARRAARRLGVLAGAVDVTFVRDREIVQLNRRWFRRDRPTDVMAFPSSDPPARSGFLGDVIVSIDAARRQARAMGHALAREAAVLAAHGTLHLLGEEDGAARGRRRMERLVEEALGARP